MGVFNSHIYMEGDGQRERFAALFFFSFCCSFPLCSFGRSTNDVSKYAKSQLLLHEY